jgi:hypothetical protein
VFNVSKDDLYSNVDLGLGISFPPTEYDVAEGKQTAP